MLAAASGPARGPVLARRPARRHRRRARSSASASARARSGSGSRSSRSPTIRARSTGIPPGWPRCSARRWRCRTSTGRPTSTTSTSTYVLPSRKLGGSLGVPARRCCRPRSTRPPSSSRSAPGARSSTPTSWSASPTRGAGPTSCWSASALKYVREDLGHRRRRPDHPGAAGRHRLDLLPRLRQRPHRDLALQLRPRAAGRAATTSRPYTGEIRTYDGFDPPLMFRYGVAFEPIENAAPAAHHLARGQPAGRQRAADQGRRWSGPGCSALALRTGYNFNADELKFSAGAGVFAAGRQHAGDRRLRVHRRRLPRRRQPAVAGGAVLMRARGGIVVAALFAAAGMIGCGAELPLPTEVARPARSRPTTATR